MKGWIEMKRLKKYGILFCMLSCIVPCCGCRSETGQPQQADSVSYEVKDKLASGGHVSCMAYGSGAGYLVTEESPRQIFALQSDGTVLDDTLVEIKEGEQICRLAPADDGVAVLTEDTATGVYAVSGYDKEGAQIYSLELPQSVAPDENEYLVDLCICGEKIVTVRSRSVQILNRQGKVEQGISCDDDITAAAKTKDGRIVCGVETGSGMEAWVLDPTEGKWAGEYAMDVESLSGADAMSDGMNYDFYYKDGDYIYGFDMEKECPVRLLSFSDSCIMGDRTGTFATVGEGTFWICTWEDGQETASVYEEISAERLLNQTVLTLGVLYDNAGVENAVVTFNQRHPDYKIEVKNYQSYADPYLQLETDIISGNAPDIFALDGMPVEQYLNNGLLTDLTPYFESDDEVDLSDLIDSVREAITKEGKVPYVASGFGIDTVAVRSSAG